LHFFSIKYNIHETLFHEKGNFKLDGGAMFGVVPKTTIWNKTNPADANLIDIAARCLLLKMVTN
jgi:hypothetical protein